MADEAKKKPAVIQLGRRSGPKSDSSGGGQIPRATHSGTLKIGDLKLPCFVLENGKRVLTQSGMSATLGISKGGERNVPGDRIANFLAGNAFKSSASASLATIRNVQFRQPQGGVANGYEAGLLVDICKVILAARRAGHAKTRYEKVCARAELLLSAFAEVGIVALVDEATGYQKDRARDALAKILEAFVAKDLQPHVKTFNPDYYTQMFRLRKWNMAEANDAQKPPLVGKLTNDIVYARLAPGVLEELRRQIPRNENGRLKHHMHRKLTPDHGHPKLREHLAGVIMAMKLSSSWEDFKTKLNIALPRFGDTYAFDL